MTTDVHIIGMGTVGRGIYVSLLKSLECVSELGNVYAYSRLCGRSRTTGEFLSTLQTGGDLTMAQLRIATGRTSLYEHETLEQLVTQLHDHPNPAFVVIAKRYSTLGDKTPFSTQHGLLTAVEGYRLHSGLGFENSELITKRLSGIGVDLEEIRKLGAAIGDFGDLVFMTTNPMDITPYVYAAASGRRPDTVFCPAEIDRKRMYEHLAQILGESESLRKKVITIGPHNHWNMLVPEWLARDGLTAEVLQDAEAKANEVAFDYLDITRGKQSPPDYIPVLYQAIIDALHDRYTKPTKIILWSPDEQMYIGWMGRLRRGCVLPCNYDEVFPGNVSTETMARWAAANNTIKEFLHQLHTIRFIPEIHDDSLEREQRELYARTPLVIFAQRNPGANSFGPLPAGDYLVAAWHEEHREVELHFAFMRSERGAFSIERELSVSGNPTPRHVVYHDGKLYYSHRDGIDAVHLKTGESQRIFSLDSQYKTGVTSFFIDGSSLLFTASGVGIGRLDMNNGKKPDWEYETTEHLDALQQHNGQYVALCGNGIVKQTAAKWEKFQLAETSLEALVIGERLFALGRTDAGLVIVDEYDSYSVPHDNLCGDSGDLRDAEVYGERLKAAVHQNHIVAVGYNGNGFIFNPETKEAQLVSTGLRRVVGFQSHSHGFLISGLDRQTGYLSSRNLRLPYGTIDEVRGLGAVPNKIVSIGGIHLR